MAFKTMRSFFTPDEDTSLESVVPAPTDPYAKQTDEMIAAMEKAPRSPPLSADEWARWGAAGPGATAPAPIDPRASVDFLERLQGKRAPADDLMPSPLPRVKMEPVPKADKTALPIPIASAPVKSDATAPVASALPPTGPQTPAGKPDSSGKGSIPAPSSEGSGGDDDLRRLRMGQVLAKAAAGFGNIVAGRQTDIGVGDVLGDRVKQIEALRAKREEQSLEQQRERATWGTSNRATLASFLAQWKGDEAKTAALEALASGADTTKPSDYSRNVVNAVMTKPKVLGAEAGVAKTEGQVETDEALRPGKVEKLRTAADLDKARIDKIRRETAANAVSLTRSARAVETAGKENVPSKEAIKYIRDDIKTAEKAITPTLENFKNIERASPGFAFGEPDKSVATLDFVAAEKLPAFANKARDLRSAVEALIVDIRHGSFGASLTAPEKASFETMLNTGLTGTVEQLSRAINMVRQKAAATAQTHFNTSLTFYPTETSQVLSSSAVFGPATRDGGVYSDVWRVQAPPTAAGGRPEKPALAAGKTALWDVAKGKWVSAPDAQVDAAVASGKYEK